MKKCLALRSGFITVAVLFAGCGNEDKDASKDALPQDNCIQVSIATSPEKDALKILGIK